jgi:TRAP-type mannitol/chloroaromatic compound transport system permease small subunit
MQDVLGVALFLVGAGFIVWSSRIAKWTSAAHSREAKNYSLKAISDVKWDSSYMMTIARIGTIFSGIVLILMAYAMIFGTINLTQPAETPNQNASSTYLTQ